MDEGADLATAGLVVAFAAVLLVISHFFIDSQSAKQLVKGSIDLKVQSNVIGSLLWPSSGQPAVAVPEGEELDVKTTLSGDQIWNDEFLLKMFLWFEHDNSGAAIIVVASSKGI
jgi:hypothetical protein